MRGSEALSSSPASRQAKGIGTQDSSHSQQIQIPLLEKKCCLQVLTGAGVSRPLFQSLPRPGFKAPFIGLFHSSPDKTASVGGIFLFPDGFVCWLHLGPPMAVWEPGPSARLILGGAGERQPTTAHRTPLVHTHPPRDGCKAFKGVWHPD